MRRALRFSLLDGALHAVMVGVSESYAGALAVELGHGPLALGLLMTLPQLAGALSQLGAGTLTGWLGGRKRLVVAGAVLQALSHLWLFALARGAEPGVGPLLAALVLYWVGGSVLAPAWGAWMAELVRGPVRPRYFARRSGAVSGALVLGFTAGGLYLNGARAARPELLARFSVLLAVALLARLLSAIALGLQADPGRGARRPPRPTGEALGEALRLGRFRVALYFALLMLGAQVAVPYFTPYMLRDLRLDYATFTWLCAAALVSKAIAFPLWHRAAEALGMRAVLLCSGVCVAVVPCLWAVFTEPELLTLAQLLSGVAWAGVELSSYQLLLASAPARSRLEFLSLSSSLTGAAQVLGAVCGAQLVTQLGLALPAVFLVSALARALPLVVLFAHRSWLPAPMVRVVERFVVTAPAVGGEPGPRGPGG